MISADTNYPIFVPDQLLTSEDLNALFGFIDSEGRLTRTNLSGIGVLCGFQVLPTSDGSHITITAGTGVTSAGHVVSLKEATYAAYKEYVPGPEPAYAPFAGNGEEGTGLKLWELFRESGETGTTQLNQAFLQGAGEGPSETHAKVALLFVEHVQEHDANCDIESCDDKGRTMYLKCKVLLARRGEVEMRLAGGLYPDSTGPYARVARVFADLPVLKTPRIVLSAAAQKNSQLLLRAFFDALGSEFGVSSLVGALESLWTIAQQHGFGADFRFAPPFSNVAALFQPPGAGETARLLRAQYVYEHFVHLVAAYEELRTFGLEQDGLCVPADDEFPRHLLLGQVLQVPHQVPIPLRHRFCPSPLHVDYTGFHKLRSLFHRLAVMASSFDLTLPTAKLDVRITPSQVGPSPLAARAIPYFYRPLLPTTAPLERFWNEALTRSGKANLNHSYHKQGPGSGVPLVRNPLTFDLEGHNFLRIEGHVGAPITAVLSSIKSKLKSARLPVDVIALGVSEAVTAAQVRDNWANGGVYAAYVAKQAEILCCLKDTMIYWGFRVPGRITRRIDDIGAVRIEEALLNELVYAELPGFMLQMDHPIFPLDITSGGNTFVGTGGTVIGAEANVAEAAGVGVFRSAAPRPARAAAPSLAEHAIASDAETQQMSPSIHVTVLKHAGSASGADSQKTVARLVSDQAPSNITLTAFPRPSFSTELNDNTAAGWLTRLYAAYCVLEEALRTGGVEAHMSGEIGAAYDALLGASQALGGLLEGYLAKHPPSLEEEGSFERHAYGSDILTRLQDKGCLCGFSALSKLVQENLAWLNRAASLFHFSSFLEHNAGIDHRGGVPMGGTFILVYDDQASGKLGGQLPGLVDRAVIADFYLPYRCCSTVPPVLFEIAPPPLPDPDPEPEPEVEPTLTIGGTADDLVLSELDPPRVVRVTPRGGELTVSGAAGFELTPREESAGASDFEEWNFDPAALTFPDGGAESQTIVIAYAVGAQTLSRSVTVVGSPRSEILSGSRIVRAAPGKPANLSLRGTVERATNPVWTVRDLGRRQAIGVTQSAAADGTLLATGSMALPAAIEVTLIAQQLGTGRVTTDTARLVEPSLLPELRGEAPETLGKMLLVIDDDLPDDPFEDVPGPSDGLASVRLQETLQSVEDEVKKQQELFGQGSKGSYAVHIVRGMTSLIKEPTFDKSRLPEALIYLSRLTLYVLRVGQKPLHMLEGQAIAALAKLSTRLDDLSTSQRAEWNMHIMVELESARLERVQRKELVDALSKLSEEIAPK